MTVHYKKILQASTLIALSGILYGFLGYFGTTILREHLSITAMLFWRFFIAGSWMFLFSIKKQPAQQIFKMDKRILLFMFILGAIGYAGSSGFYFVATQYTGTGLAMVIFFSYPIIVALTSWITHKKNPAIGTIIILILMTLGLTLLRNPSGQSVSSLGIFFAMLSATCYAFYVMGSKHSAVVAINSTVLTIIVCFVCALLLLALSLFTHSFSFPQTTRGWIYLLAFGVLATALPIQLMLEGLKYVSSMRASIISVLEPLVTVFVGILLLDESVSHLQLLGAFIILSSAILIQFQREL